MKKYYAVSLLIFALTACSSDKQPEIDYHTTGAKKAGESLIVPPDLTGLIQNDRFALPAASGAVRASELENKEKDKSVRNATVLPSVENMHIEREGSLRWLAIDEKQPAEIWPLLKAFWQENGFIIESENPETGFMQTQWAENRAMIPNDFIRSFLKKVGLGGVYSSAYRDRFLVRMERTQNNGVSVNFTHQGMEEVLVGKDKSTSRWIPRENDPNLEAALLARFMMRLGADQDEIQQELEKTQNQKQSTQLAVLEQHHLSLSGSHSRNVHRLGLALDRVGLTVQNFANDVYTVQPASENETVSNKKPGLLTRWFKNKETPKPLPTILVKIQNQSAEQDIITLHNADGSAYQQKDEKEILNRLWRELR